MRAVVYARTSTLDQAREEKASIPDQIKWARSLTGEKGWIWAGEYIEPGILGDVELEEREAMIRLLKDAKDGLFDIVLIYHSSRFAREADIGMRACRLLGQLKIQTYIRNSPIEPVLPEKFAWGSNIGSLYMTAFSLIGDFQENVARSERVRSGFQGLAQRGKLVFAPYGYIKVPKIITNEVGRQQYDWFFEIDQSKAIVVQRIFSDYMKVSGSIRSIMLKLNNEKVPSPSGEISNEAWSTATVKNILSNPAYIKKVRWGRKLGGKYKQGKTITGNQKRILTKPNEWILTNGNHPRIIDDKLFNNVKEKLKLRYVLRGRAIASRGLLIGLVICGRCGRKAHYKTSVYKRKKNYSRSNYLCQSYFRHKTCQRHIISAIKIETAVIGELNKITTDPTYREKLLKENKVHQNSNLKERLKLLYEDEKKISTKQQRIIIAYEDGKLSLEELGKNKERLDGEVKIIQVEINKIEQTLDDQIRSIEVKKKFIEILHNFNKALNSVERDKQKEVIQKLISSIIVKGGRITINYRI